MRVLHLTDTHLGAEMQTWGHPRGWRRAIDCASAFERALEPAMRGEVDLVVHSGDVFDRSSPPAEAVAYAQRLLSAVARCVPVVVIAGNHDRRGVRPHLVSTPGLHLVDEPTRLVFGALALGLVPYRREAAAWSEDARLAVGTGVDLLVAHQSFDGARVPGFVFRHGHHAETVGASGLPAGVAHVMCGHLHPRQEVRLGAATIVHPGSTVRTSFVEGPAAKGYALWALGRRVSWRFVDLPERPLVRLRAESDLAAVASGALVRLERDIPADLAREVVARGAWFANVKPPFKVPVRERQAELF